MTCPQRIVVVRFDRMKMQASWSLNAADSDHGSLHRPIFLSSIFLFPCSNKGVSRAGYRKMEDRKMEPRLARPKYTQPDNISAASNVTHRTVV